MSYIRLLALEFALRILIRLVLLSLLLTACAWGQSAGEQIFTQHCIACHGGDLSGHTNFGKKATIPDLRGPLVQGRTDVELYESIGHGVGHKAYPHAFLSRGLSNVNVRDLIQYIRSQAAVKK